MQKRSNIKLKEFRFCVPRTFKMALKRTYTEKHFIEFKIGRTPMHFSSFVIGYFYALIEKLLTNVLEAFVSLMMVDYF